MYNKKEMIKKTKSIIFRMIMISIIEDVMVALVMVLILMLLLTIKLPHNKIYHHRMSLGLDKLIIIMKNVSHKSLR